MKTVKNYFKKFYLEVEKYIEGIHVLNSGISEEKISDFEETYNICLPHYYREWLKTNNGGELFATPAGTTIAGILGKRKPEKGVLYLEDNFDIKKRVGIPNYLFMLASMCTGDIIGFDLRKTNEIDGVIVCWNHDNGEIDEQWSGLAKWLEDEMDTGKMLVNYDGSESDYFANEELNS